MKRQRGTIDRFQSSKYSENRRKIRRVLQASPWSNISQVAEGTGLTRRIVRKHLTRMVQKRQVWKVKKQYALEEWFSSSYSLTRAVRKALGSEFQSLSFALAGDVGGCYFATAPRFPHSGLGEITTALFELQAVKFGAGLFWFEDMVAYAVRRGYLSQALLKNQRVDMARLKSGLAKCFRRTNLFVMAFAINLVQLQKFLATTNGQAWATRILQSKWPSILERASKDWLSEDETLIGDVSYD